MKQPRDQGRQHLLRSGYRCRSDTRILSGTRGNRIFVRGARPVVARRTDILASPDFNPRLNIPCSSRVDRIEFASSCPRPWNARADGTSLRVAAWTLDLGRDGVGLFVEDSLIRGETVRVIVEDGLPSRRRLRTWTGRVVNVAGGKEGHRLGVSFDDPNAGLALLRLAAASGFGPRIDSPGRSRLERRRARGRGTDRISQADKPIDKLFRVASFPSDRLLRIHRRSSRQGDRFFVGSRLRHPSEELRLARRRSHGSPVRTGNPYVRRARVDGVVAQSGVANAGNGSRSTPSAGDVSSPACSATPSIGSLSAMSAISCDRGSCLLGSSISPISWPSSARFS